MPLNASPIHPCAVLPGLRQILVSGADAGASCTKTVYPPHFCCNFNRLHDFLACLFSHFTQPANLSLTQFSSVSENTAAQDRESTSQEQDTPCQNTPNQDTSDQDTLYMVMPAYNEEDNIETVVTKWYPLVASASENSRLVIADSGSTDKTHLILSKLQEDRPKLIILSDTIRYYGPKLIALYNYAIASGADYVFQTDSDDQTSPEEFASFWQDRKNYDAIFGWRKKRGDGKLRAFAEMVVRFLVFCFFFIRVPDANAPFRLMRCDVLKQGMPPIPPDCGITNIMLTVFFVFYKHKVCFREVTFRPRIAGTSCNTIKNLMIDGVKTLRDFANFRRWIAIRKR